MGIPATLSSVPNQTPYMQYVATNGQTVFPYPFVITQDADLIVVPNGVTLPADSGYTLSGVGNPTGGNVTFTAGRTAGDIITLYRDIGIQRISQIAQNSGFSSALFNAEFNNVYLILQQLQESIALSLQIPNTNSPASVTTLTPALYANKYLAFDAHGNPTPALLTPSGSLTAAIIGGLTGPATAAETAVGVTIVNPQSSVGTSLRYGLVPNSSAAATANTAIMRQLVSYKLHATGWTGKFRFDNTTGADVYWFNDFIDFREGISVDLNGCTWQFTKAAPSGNENNSGALMGIRDFIVENGTINFNFPSGVSTGCAAIFLGARGIEGTYYVPLYDAAYLAATGRTQGNIIIRNVYITSNAPGQRCIEALGGLRNVLVENVWMEGQGAADGFYAEYGFATDGGGVQSARQSSHGTNIRFINCVVTNLLSTGVGINYNGAYNVMIDGLRVIGAAGACGFGYGEAFYYNPWAANDGSGSTTRTVTIRNVIAKSLTGSGITIQGANTSSVAVGYMATVINALATPALYVAQTDLVSAIIDGFAMNGTSAGNGLQIVGADRLEVSNGRLVGFGNGINMTNEVTRYTIRGVEIFDSNAVGIVVGSNFPVYPTQRLSVGSITDSFIAGSGSNAINLAFTNACKIEGNRFGYLVAHDGKAETTQLAAVSAAATALGVICDTNYVAALASGVAYALAGSASGGSTVRNASGVVTSSGLWESALNSVSPDRGDVSFNYVPHADITTQYFNTPLTTGRTITLTTTTALIGDEVTVVRTAAATGVSTLTVGGPGKTLALGTWGKFKYNGAWIETASGSL